MTTTRGNTPSGNTPLHPRRHKGLWYVDPDRLRTMAVAMTELLALRAREDARQADRRNDRARVRSRRQLGAPGALGLTVREIDDALALGTLDERALATAIDELGVVDADERSRAAAFLAYTEAPDAFASAWHVALRAAQWSRDDWQHDRYVLTENGARKLAWVRIAAFRWALAMISGFGSRPLGSIDALWLLSARPLLADHEIGRVLEASAHFVGTPAAERIQAAIAQVKGSDDDLARIAAKRWQRLRDAGFGAATRRTQRRG